MELLCGKGTGVESEWEKQYHLAEQFRGLERTQMGITRDAAKEQVGG